MAKNMSEISKIKHHLYISLARLALKGKLTEKLDQIPEQIARPDSPRYRCCEYKERAILEERIKLALGFDPEKHIDESPGELADHLEQLDHPGRVIQVLSIACDRCPIDKFRVTDACRNCVAHSCVNSCPKNAIVVIQNQAFIDQGKCIECGRCKDACLFGAIHQNSRPCERACAVEAIQADHHRRASIDYEKCVGCGSCIKSCPFGAIADRTWIVQVVQMLMDEREDVQAILAPSFVGQFGAKVAPETIHAALREIGFAAVHEAALGADMVALAESEELAERIADGQPFMTSSCCPGFLKLVQKHYPELQQYASQTVSPMLALARSLKVKKPESKVVFIGPCIGKKVEAKVEESVDAVLTFEELACIFISYGVDIENYSRQEEMINASRNGRNFAWAGGLSGVMKEIFIAQNRENVLMPCHADGLNNCKVALEELASGKNESNFLEGMACSGGCVGGPGVMSNSKVTAKLVQRFAEKARFSLAIDHSEALEEQNNMAEKMERGQSK